MSRRGQLPAAPGTHDAEMLRGLSNRELQHELEVRMERAELANLHAGQHPAHVDRALVHASPPFRRAWDELKRRSRRNEW